MKLIFTKDAKNEIDVKIQKGTVSETFTYTEMVKQLLSDKTIEAPDFNNLSVDEQGKLNGMLSKVQELFKGTV